MGLIPEQGAMLELVVASSLPQLSEALSQAIFT
jgi:hypothetical protein